MPGIFQTRLGIKTVSNFYDEQFWGDGDIVAGGGFTTGIGQGNFVSTFWAQSPAAIGDEISWPVSLTPGNYDFTVYAQANFVQGIQDFLIDGNVFMTNDWYSAGGDPNASFSTPVTIADDNVLLSSLVTGQNGASSGFSMSGIYFVFRAV